MWELDNHSALVCADVVIEFRTLEACQTFDPSKVIFSVKATGFRDEPLRGMSLALGDELAAYLDKTSARKRYLVPGMYCKALHVLQPNLHGMDGGVEGAEGYRRRFRLSVDVLYGYSLLGAPSYCRVILVVHVPLEYVAHIEGMSLLYQFVEVVYRREPAGDACAPVLIPRVRQARVDAHGMLVVPVCGWGLVAAFADCQGIRRAWIVNRSLNLHGEMHAWSLGTHTMLSPLRFMSRADFEEGKFCLHLSSLWVYDLVVETTCAPGHAVTVTVLDLNYLRFREGIMGELFCAGPQTIDDYATCNWHGSGTVIQRMLEPWLLKEHQRVRVSPRRLLWLATCVRAACCTISVCRVSKRTRFHFTK